MLISLLLVLNFKKNHNKVHWPFLTFIFSHFRLNNWSIFMNRFSNETHWLLPFTLCDLVSSKLQPNGYEVIDETTIKLPHLTSEKRENLFIFYHANCPIETARLIRISFRPQFNFIHARTVFLCGERRRSTKTEAWLKIQKDFLWRNLFVQPRAEICIWQKS